MGCREASSVLTDVRRLALQDSTVPSGVVDQSRARVSAAISPEPRRKIWRQGGYVVGLNELR